MAWSLLPASPSSFNWTWVIELIVCVLLVNWFLFYFNRLFGTLVSWGLRTYSWHKYRVWIDIGALQISLLGGRIFFKQLRYHAENETVLIQHGFITWRYWKAHSRQVNLHRPNKKADVSEKKEEVADSASEDTPAPLEDDEFVKRDQKNNSTEARIAVNVTGLEWFVYNRTPAYDAIIAANNASTSVAPQGDVKWATKGAHGSTGQSQISNNFRRSADDGQFFPNSSSGESSLPKQAEVLYSESAKEDAPQTPVRPDTASTTSDAQASEATVSSFYPFVLRFLPVAVECSRGAISLGNEGTRAIVVTTFAKAKGHFDAASAAHRDIYRQVFDFEIEHPVVQMKPNPDYRRTQYTAAERILQGLDTPSKRKRWWQPAFHFHRRKQKAADQLRRLVPGFRGSVGSFRPHSLATKDGSVYTAFDTDREASTVWYGLDRYLADNDRDDHEGWAHIDYARFSTILDSPAIHLNFYWDEPGLVVAEDMASSHDQDINGAHPPAYGMGLIVRGGDVNYGPWADRLRLEIQSAFFPSSYMSSVPAATLKAGDTRQYSRMAIDVEIQADVSLRVPTREESKDWQWRGRAHAAREAAMQRKHRERKHFRFRRTHKPIHGNNVRPFGWFNFTVGKGSVVAYDMAMLAGDNGYPNSLHINLDNTRVTSSVNHALLWRCPTHKIDADLSYPLGWNDIHEWTFNVQSDRLDMFILRDHMFLLIDLIGDFTAGQKSDFMTFIPYRYNIGLLFHGLKLYLNANDFNIIDKPDVVEENSFLVLGFGLLAGVVGIPLEYYAPRQSKVTFKAEGADAFLDISTPTWNTLNTFLDDPMIPDLKTLMVLKGMTLDGSYNYWTSIAPDLTDSLFMTITGAGPRFHLHGFLIRAFMNVKENYFGEHLHFRTLEEYQDLISDPDMIARLNQRPQKKENDLDVILTVRADKCAIVLPANQYTRRKGVRADILLVEADMRFTNYYMDLQVNSSPVECSLESIRALGQAPDVTNCQLFIESAIVVGHRLFGAPPVEPPYANHWDVDVGLISGQCSSSFLQTLILSIESLVFTMDDFENALPDVLKIPIHDVSFLRAKAAGARIWLLSEEAAFLAEFDPLTVDFDDWAGENFAKHVNVHVPRLCLGAVELKSALRHHETPATAPKTFALFNASLRLATLDRTQNLPETRALQQDHIKFHDQRTRRADWLLHKSHHGHVHRPAHVPEWARHPPSMPVPSMPMPLAKEDVKNPLQTPNQRKSSFASTSSTSGSVSISGGSRNGKSSFREEKQEPRRTRPAAQPASSWLSANSRRAPSASKEPQDMQKSASKASVMLAGPWAAPYFTLQEVILDDSDLPEATISPPTARRRTSRHINLPEDDLHSGNDIAHMGILCLLENGITGFCTPQLLRSIAALIKELQPKDSLDRLDSVQRGVIGLVAKRFAPQKSSKDLDLAIRLPQAHIRLKHDDSISSPRNAAFNDHYDISLTDGHADCRFMSRQDTDSATPSFPLTMLVHTSLRHLSVSATDNAVASQTPAYASVSISDIGIWFSTTKDLRGTVQVSSALSELGAAQIRPMAQLLHRTTEMIERIVDNFTHLEDSTPTSHLIYHLTQAATTASDPTFLTRPSYVLRSASTHARMSESWKILARLRNTYDLAVKQHLPSTQLDCACQNDELQESHRQEMLTTFDQWHTWDAVPDNKVPVMTAVFGQDLKPDGSDADSKMLQLELLIGQCAFVLDPGPHQSAFSLNGVETAVMLDPKGRESGGAPKLRVQTYMSDTVLSIDWEVLDLTANLLDLIQTSQGRPNYGAESAPLPATTKDIPMEVEIIVGADLVSISAASANLQLKLGSEFLRTSVVLVPGKEAPVAPIFSIASTTAMAKLDGVQRSLLAWKLSDPKIYGSVLPPDTLNARPGIVRIGTACEKLRFSLKEDIPAVTHIVRKVIENEVKEAHARFSGIHMLNKRAPQPDAKHSFSPQIDVHLAMFLHDYKLDFALLPAFSYGITGKVARTSVTPQGIGKFTVNLDLKQHEHSFRGIWSNTFEAPAVLRMPPINGRMSVVNASNATTLRAHTTVELIEFEAAAVRACFDVVNQPGFLNTIKSIQEDIQNIQTSTEKIFGPAKSTNNAIISSAATLFRYSVDGTIAGIRIHCVAPNPRDGESQAHLEFGLGATALKASNLTQGSVQVHERPQFKVSVREVGLALYRKARYGGRVNYGQVALGLRVGGVTEKDEKGNLLHVYHLSSSGITIDMFQETASLVIDVASFLQAHIKSITISEQAKSLKPIRRFTLATLDRPALEPDESTVEQGVSDDDDISGLFDSVFSVNIDRIQIRWGLHKQTTPISPGRALEDLVFSIRKIELQTRQEGSARLSIQHLQLQLVPHSQDLIKRSANSALMPEVIFSAAYLSTKKDRRVAFQAKGKVLDIRLAADFVVPATQIQKTLAAAGAEIRSAKEHLGTRATTPEAKRTTGAILGRKRFASLLVDADFAGAIVHVSPRQEEQQTSSVFGILKGPRRSQAGRYGQIVHGEGTHEAVLQAPGVALKVEYRDNGQDDPNMSTEVKVAASSNTLYPSVVPLILDISSSIKEILGETEPTSSKQDDDNAPTTAKYISDATRASGDPAAILGRTKLNAGLWVQKQEFSLSCQPIARVSATAKFEDIFLTVNTVQGIDQTRFFSILTTFNKLQASVQHVYSRESTASFDVDSIVVSLMNSKHISGTTGISAIVTVSPVKTDINAKQMQDFLLFREIWYPAELRGPAKEPVPATAPSESQAIAIQRYQQMTAGQGTLPWNAVVSIQEVKMQVDFGQSLGKSTFNISKLWASSKKNSDAEQNLCIGFEKVGIDSSGRMSGFVELQNFRVRTGIRWPADSTSSTRAPLVQASVGFDHLRVKGAFDYQPFIVADISFFEVLMYNVRQFKGKGDDRLVAILNGGKIQVFCTALAGAQGLALIQAFERLIEEKREAYRDSLHELDKFLRRKSVFPSATWTATSIDTTATRSTLEPIKEGFSLHTDVVVSLNAIDLGVFPTTFFDNQILKVEAVDAQARFAVATTEHRTHSALGMRLGQVRVALSSVSKPTTKALGEVSVPDVIERATTSRGGTIMKVPRLVSSMQTWQTEHSNEIEYVFRSVFEGKVDVGWNYSRISFIRGMWQTHSRAFAQRLGKPLPEPAVKITAEPASRDAGGEGKEKITAVVNMPTSKFKYVALEPPVIDTPQLRDMGEATPPLEWIGLHRDRLPEATHSVAIVTLLEVAKEVEGAYVRILGM